MRTTITLLVSAGLFFLGVSYLYYPDIVKKINKWLKEKLLNDEKISKNRKKFGLIYILLSFIIIYTGIIFPRITISANEQYIRNKLNLSWFYYNQGKYAEAQKVIESVLQMDAENQNALQQMCVISFSGGDYEKAKFYCRRALKKDPDNLKVKNIYDKIVRKARK